MKTRGQETTSSGLGLTEEDGKTITKKCAKCKEAKPTTDYTFRRLNSTSLESYCRSCKADYDKIYRQKHKKLHAAQHRAWWYKKRIKELQDGKD